MYQGAHCGPLSFGHLDLPSGAQIMAVGLDGNDDVIDYIEWGVLRMKADNTCDLVGWCSRPFAGRYSSGTAILLTPETVGHANCHAFAVYLGTAAASRRLMGKRAHYKLRVPPAPGAATFSSFLRSASSRSPGTASESGRPRMGRPDVQDSAATVWDNKQE